MYAYRATWHIKEGRIQEAVELLQRALNAYKEQGLVARIYHAPQVSQQNILVWEENWETQEAHDKWWAEGSKVHTSKEFWTQWAEVVEGEPKNETWSLLN